MTIPPPPPGFELEPMEQGAAMPPPPPGFELITDNITDLPQVNALPPDFSGVTGSVESTADIVGRDVMGDGWRPGLLRDVMMGGRSVLQGAGSLVGALGGDAFNHYIANPIERAAGLSQSGSFRDAGGALADKLGLPKPQSSGERVLTDVGEALTGTGLTMGVGGLLNAGRSAVASPTMASRAGDFLTAQPVLQTVSTATGAGAAGATREAGGGELAQVFAGLAGGLAPSAVTAGVPMALRGAFRGGEQNRRNLATAIDEYKQLGSTPSIGQGTGSWIRQGVETLLAGGPTSGGVMARFANRQGDEISSGLEGFARRMSNDPTAEGAGRAIEQGVDAYTGRVRSIRSQLYDQVDRHIPADTPVAMTRTQQELQRLTTPTPGAVNTTGRMISPELKEMADDIAADIAAAQAAGGTGIPYQAVKDIRSKLGEKAFTFDLTPDKPTAQLREVYRALTDDMQDLARNAGPSAERAVRKANKFYADSRERLELLERVVGKHGGPEKVFQAAIAGTREGATVLKQVMSSLPRDAQRDVTAAVIKRMGIPTPGQAGLNAAEEFSAATFLTNWNRFSPEARQALFNRFGPEMSENISKIAKVAESIKHSDGILRSTSGTGPNTLAAGYWGSLGLSLLSGNIPLFAKLAASGAGANVVARVMTNPSAVRWFARTTELPTGALPAQLNVLKRIAAESKDEDVEAFALALEDAAKEGAEVEQQGNEQ